MSAIRLSRAGIFFLISFLALQGCPTEGPGTGTDTDGTPTNPATEVEEESENPASSPSGPEEIPGPAAFRFPSSITVDVSEASSSLYAALVAPGGEFSEIITVGGDIVGQIEQFMDYVLSDGGILGAIEVPRDDNTHNFTTTVSSSSRFFPLEELKIDFSPFASLDEETTDCSGSTEGEPVCFQIWVGGDPLILGYLSKVVTDLANGAGHVWFQPPRAFFGAQAPAEGTEMRLALDWDHTDPDSVWTEVFFGGGVSDTVIAERARALLTREIDSEGEAITSIQMSSTFASYETLGGGSVSYIGRWKGNAWSGKVKIRLAGLTYEKSGICASLLSGNGVAASYCSDFDVQSVDYPSLPEAEVFARPEGFLETPQF